MSSSYSTNLLLIEMTAGDPGVFNSWGTNLNNGMIALVDSAIAGILTVNVTTLTGYPNAVPTSTSGAADQARNAHFNFTGTLTGNTLVLFPSGLNRNFTVNNNTTGAFSLAIGVNNGSGGALGNTVGVPRGQSLFLLSDGTQIGSRFNAFQGGLTVDTLTVTNNITGFPPGGLLNYIVGGDFSCNPWQRGTTFAATAGPVYTADRWMVGRGNNDLFYTVSQQATSDPAFAKALRLQRTAGDVLTTAINIGTSLETINSLPLQGQTVTLCVRGKKGASLSGTASIKLVTGTGSDQNCISTNFSGQATVINIDLAAGFSSASVTNIANTVTLGSSITQLGIIIAMVPVGTAGAADLLDIEMVQLQIGPFFTGFERRQFGQEVALCQRYFCKTFSQGITPAAGLGFTLGGNLEGVRGNTGEFIEPIANWAFPTEMRTAPTITLYNPSGLTPGQWAVGGGSSTANARTLATGTRSTAIDNTAVPIDGAAGQLFIAATANAEL